jgi:dihydroorotase
VEAIRRARERRRRTAGGAAPPRADRRGDSASYPHGGAPLRSAADVAACRAGLVDGTIDAIATDHAPHAVHEKDQEFTEAPPGMIGLETAVAVVLDLVREGLLAPLELVRRLSTNPARILRRPGGSLARGEPADLVVVDPERRWTYDPAKGFSKSATRRGREALQGRAVAP